MDGRASVPSQPSASSHVSLLARFAVRAPPGALPQTKISQLSLAGKELGETPATKEVRCC